MKKIALSYLALFVMIASSSAQDFSQEVVAKVGAFDFMIGNWSGIGEMILPDGTTSKSDVKEVIVYKSGKTVIEMEGTGTITLPTGEKKVVHDALGVLSYDIFQKKYKLNSYISRGMQTQANIELKGEGNAIWWFSAGPQGTIRYTLNVQNGKWNEIGERSTDGEKWVKFFEMNLVKQ